VESWYQVDRSGLTICAFQEVRKLEQGNTIIEIDKSKYEVHWCGRKRLRREGVALVIRIDPKVTIHEVSYIGPRLISPHLLKFMVVRLKLLLFMPQQKNLLSHPKTHFITNYVNT